MPPYFTMITLSEKTYSPRPHTADHEHDHVGSAGAGSLSLKTTESDDPPIKRTLKGGAKIKIPTHEVCIIAWIQHYYYHIVIVKNLHESTLIETKLNTQTIYQTRQHLTLNPQKSITSRIWNNKLTMHWHYIAKITKTPSTSGHIH